MILAQVDQLLAFTLLVLNQMVPGLEKNVRALEHWVREWVPSAATEWVRKIKSNDRRNYPM